MLPENKVSSMFLMEPKRLGLGECVGFCQAEMEKKRIYEVEGRAIAGAVQWNIKKPCESEDCTSNIQNMAGRERRKWGL